MKDKSRIGENRRSENQLTSPQDQAAILFTPPVPSSIAENPSATQTSVPRISDYLNHKIRNLSFCLIILVVFNHSTNSDLGYDRSFSTFKSVGPLDLQNAPYLTFIECLVSDAMGKITVPFFFFASGYLFFFSWKPTWQGFRQKIQRRIYTILIPFLVWNLIGKIGYYVIFLTSSYPSLHRNYLVGTIDITYILTMFFRMELPYQLWFMHHLMLIMLAAPLWALLNRLLGYGFIPVILIFYFININMPWIDQRGLSLFCLGGILGARAHSLELASNRVRWSILVLWVMFAIAYAFWALTTESNLRPMFRALVLLGMVGAWAAYDLLPKSVHLGLTNYAPYRFFIYVAHEPILTALQNGFYHYAPRSQLMYLGAYILLPSTIVAICVATGISIRKRWERLYYYLSGGR